MLASRFFSVQLSVLAFAIGAGILSAQVNTATVYGNITDPSGALVPNVHVELKDVTKGATLSAVSNQQGEFTFSFVPVGAYTLTMSAPGFQTQSQPGLSLTAGQNVRINVVMQLGATKSMVTVEGTTPLVNAVNAQQEQTLDREEVKELPTSRLDWTNLLAIGTGTAQGGLSGVSLNGLPPAAFNLTVDGTAASGDPEISSLGQYLNFNTIKVISNDAIQEITVTKGIAPAEIAATMSGNVNIITKSGTNSFHGDAFANNQVAAYNARNPLLATKPGDTFNLFGAALGGPILRNKIFFFGSYEGLQERAQTLVSGDVPTPLFRSQATSANPAYATALNPYPLPNQPYGPTALTARFISAGATSSSDNNEVIRGDYQITSNDLLTLRYTHSAPTQVIPRVSPDNSRTFTATPHQGTISYTHSWGSAVAVTRFGYSRDSYLRLDGFALVPGIDDLQVNGLDNGGGESFSIEGSTTSLEQTLAFSRGRNTVKFGGIYQRWLTGRNDVDIPVLGYNTFNDLLAGNPSQIVINFGTLPYAVWIQELGGFAQDDFKFNRRLTINLGLRYDYFTVPKERDGRLINRADYGFGPFLPASAVYNPDTNNFAPRIGFAYSIDTTGRTVIRGGFGMFYSPHPLLGGPADLVQNFVTLSSGNISVVPFRVTLTGAQASQLGIDYPVTNANTEAQIANGLTFPYSNSSVNTNFPDPFSLQYTLELQRELTSSMVLSVAYVGNRGVKLNMVRYQNLPSRSTGIQPIPGFGTFRYWDTSNSTNYNSLQSSLKKRLSNGILFDLNYTFSHALGYGSSDLQLEQAPQDNNNIRGDYGPTPFDVRHTFTGAIVYQIPFAKWISSHNSLVRKTLDGWELTSVLTAQTGLPLNITETSNYQSSRPDYLGGNPIATGFQNSRLYLNRTAFALVPTPNRNPIRPGNLGRDAIYAPGAWTINFGLAKTIRFKEKISLQIRADAFNLLNHPNPGGIATNISSGSFGTINAITTRTMQLGARLSF